MKEVDGRTRKKEEPFHKAPVSRKRGSHGPEVPSASQRQAVGNQAVQHLLQSRAVGHDPIVLQREAKKSRSMEGLDAVHTAARSSGERLDRATREFMESRFNEDFRDVRI